MDETLPIIDAHLHFWDLDGPVRYKRGADRSGLPRSYLPADLRGDSVLHDLAGAVHVDAGADSTEPLAETRWLTRLAAETGLPSAIVAHARVDAPDAADVIAAQAAFPLVRGILTQPVIADGPNGSVRGQKWSLQDPAWRKGLDLLRRHGLSWDLCVPWYRLEEAADICREHPGLRIALNHAGCPTDRSKDGLRAWKRGMEAVASCPNVHCKISGLAIAGQPWTLQAHGAVIRESIGMFGVDRCMFASNHPVDRADASWDHLYRQFKYVTAGMVQEDRRKLFAANAAAFYRIPLAG